MERIVYRITLDSHKTGIQRTLQGFETADNMARSIAVNITASGDTYEIPLDNVVAMMYVTTPSASEPSINECRIEDNTIYYDVLPIVEEGITEMQIKLIETSMDGAKRVLLAPKFVVEVTESGTEDGSAEQTTTFTALENAIAKAHGVYDQRLLNIEIGPDCVFRAIYADGTVYENHYLHEALYNGNALMSESWAKGGTGVREGEDINNSLYFSNVSRSASAEARQNASAVRELTDMARLYSTYTSFDTNFATGELEYISATHNFDVDETTGELVVEGETFEPDAIVEKAVGEFLEEKTQAISKNTEDIAKNTEIISEVRGDLDKHTHTAVDVGARPNTWMPSAEEVGASPSDHSHSAEDVGAHPNTWMPTASDVGAISLYDSSEEITLEELNTSNKDLNGYISNNTAAKITGLDASYYSVWSHFNSGNRTQFFIPIARPTNAKMRIMSADEVIYCGDILMGYLPLTGGNLNGLLHVIGDIVVNHLTQITGNEEISCLRAIRPDGTSRGIEVVNSGTGIEEKYAARFTTYDGTTWKTSQLFGQHNKPHGTFTGNANKTSRTINIGGVYSTATELFVSGNGYSFIITPNGAIGMHYNTRSIKILLESECKYMNGVLTIATDDAAINASGITYFYQLS